MTNWAINSDTIFPAEFERKFKINDWITKSECFSNAKSLHKGIKDLSKCDTGRWEELLAFCIVLLNSVEKK